MESRAPAKTTYYNGIFPFGVDDKRRIQIPARWRPEEEDVELTLILWPQSDAGACLRVLPPPQMARLMEDLEKMPNEDPRKVVLKRFIGSESAQATVDKGGRVCLPEGMAKAAGITDSAVLVGLLDRFEIWSPDRYKKVRTSDADVAQEAFKMMG